jgi:hypothetical protein
LSTSPNWITSPYSASYTVEDTPGIETNLPILQVFSIDSFPEAKQPPRVNDCFTITYNPGYGSDEPVEEFYQEDYTVKDPATVGFEPPHTGDVLHYWQGSDGHQYNPGDVISSLSEDLILTAVWQAEPRDCNHPPVITIKKLGTHIPE